MIGTTTRRLLLRPHEERDFDRLWDMLNDPLAKRFTGGVTRLGYDERKTMFLEDIKAPVLDGAMEFAVLERRSGGDVYIGYCGSRRSDEFEDNEFFYGFCRDSWGKGYGYEAASAALGWLFHNFTPVRYAAAVDEENAASVRILKKLNFKKARGVHNGDHGGLSVYVVERADFLPEG